MLFGEICQCLFSIQWKSVMVTIYLFLFFSVFHRSEEVIQVCNDIFYQKHCNAYISFMIKTKESFNCCNKTNKKVTPTYS